ncbi:lipopolysaccharide assembly LapA domain-containing protein [Halobacillus sp. Marseille-Q1614]|uniref:LapA family protein n=1 Tax=Halobacillus sp. Marseille-Q1614 TaxID=2709134 RepID=UPI00156F811A|nr:lipopolysaccharide assembly protein LapA domain-containing protein [Halobacillus sp. Marseille-Q1614]
MKGQSYIILALIFALLIAVFAVINVGAVEVNYLFGTGEAPLILIIIVSVLMGGITTASVGAVRYYQLKRENRSLRHKLKELTPAQVEKTEEESQETKREPDI